VVSTFHSACLRMLRAHADVLGYQRGFTIYDAGDAETAVERIMKELNLDTKRLSPRSVSAAISAAKNEMLSPDAYAEAVTVTESTAHCRDLSLVHGALDARQRDGLRRPALERGGDVEEGRRDSQQLSEPLQIPVGRRVPGHQACRTSW